MKSGHSDGYTSVSTLLMLSFVLVLAIGIAQMVNALRAPVSQLQAQVEGVRALESALAEFEKLRAEEKAKPSDSRFGASGKLNETLVEGWKVKIEDVSSKLNLNWLNVNIIENTVLNGALKPGKTTAQLVQHREDTGFTYDFGTVYGEFFPPEEIEALFSPYSYANINTSFETSIETLFRFRTESLGNHSAFRSAVQLHLAQKKLWSDAELKIFLGLHEKKVYPFINAIPSMNVNFVPEAILRAVLNYPFPDGILPNASGIADQIVNLRKTSGISADQLKGMLVFSKDQQKRVAEYLGTRTWCWKITVEKEGNQSLSAMYWIGQPESASP